MNNPNWLDELVNNILIEEAESFGFDGALSSLPAATQALVREVLERTNDSGTAQRRRGSPASDINMLYPVILYLIMNGLSANEAWSQFTDRIPRRGIRNAQRQLNRARGELEKELHTAASSIAGGNPRRFEAAYRRIGALLSE